MPFKRNLTVPECDRYRRDCNFTAEELAVFYLRVKGISRVAIASALHVSVATVDRRIRSVTQKIEAMI